MIEGNMEAVSVEEYIPLLKVAGLGRGFAES